MITIISYKISIPNINNNLLNNTFKSINYSFFINEARLTNYYHSILIPKKTIITQSINWLLNNFKLNDEEINVLFTNKKELSNSKINANKGLISNHEFINEVTNKTPIQFNKDSINDSLMIIKLFNHIKELRPAIPHTLIELYNSVISENEVIKPYNNFNICSLNNGLIFNGPDVINVRNKTLIKHLGDNHYLFNNNFYSLGRLGLLCSKLNDLWFRA